MIFSKAKPGYDGADLLAAKLDRGLEGAQACRGLCYGIFEYGLAGLVKNGDRGKVPVLEGFLDCTFESGQFLFVKGTGSGVTKEAGDYVSFLYDLLG